VSRARGGVEADVLAVRTRERATSAVAPSRRPYTVVKRAMDLVGAAVLLLLFAPVFVVVALLVRVTSRGPVFFRQERAGLHGRPFRVLKFRTMVADWSLTPDEQAAFERQFKLEHDRRVTAVGRFLRKSSLDELPQLWNVIRGEMSLVGPRPVVSDEIEQMYSDVAEVLLSVRPGLTGLWQVSGRSSLPYGDRVRLDLEYVEHHNLRFDLGVLARTPWAVLSGRGAV